MFTIENSQITNLRDLTTCHMACFTDSLATRLGRSYVQKTLEWFLENPNRFLFHITNNGRVVGYCGGFMPLKPGDGSSSGMLQYAFKQAIRGILKKPVLLFHPEVTQNYPFLWMNIKRKITGKAKPFKPVSDSKPFNQHVGLVVIGVHPDFRGQGLAQQLMTEFENKTKQFHQSEMVLSVKKNNQRAIKAYLNFGWTTREEHTKTFVMHKFI
ncbi:MAG: family N-acetyltransferase [Segetibacter sp.]|jgi:ribosomal protein S18 acetylase RimI-like enzyme|nr:family N-acetyltransferase [Segetibacter sp.]